MTENRTISCDRILLDIESQRDFFTKGGSCYRPGSKQAAARIRQLFVWANQQQVPVLSTVLRVRPHERGPLARTPHCVEGTPGERKLPRTIFRRRINLGMGRSADLPEALFQTYQQVVVEKRNPDILAHAQAERLISELPPATTFILCGAGLAGGILQAAIGLRNRGFPVILVRDAALTLNDDLEAMALLRMEAKGVVFASTGEIVSPPRPRRRRAFRPAVRVRSA